MTAGANKHAEAVIDALRQLDQGAMVAYPEAAPTLTALRDAGLTVGVCSNWGWELNAYLDEVGLLHLIDASITSARAGSRKPHPRIYAKAADALGVDPTDVLFVGDSWEPDVAGHAASACAPSTSVARTSDRVHPPPTSNRATTASGT